jgi:hypothetical protein
MDISKIKIDTKAQNDGVTVELFPGVTVTVRSTATNEYRNALQREVRKQRRFIDANIPIPAEIMDGVVARLLAEHVIVGWSGLTEDGKPFAFTPENVAKIVSDPEYRQMRDMIADIAGENETFRRREVSDAKGN